MNAAKAIISIPLTIAIVFALVVYSCRIAGKTVYLDPAINAGIVAAIAGIVGLIPTLRSSGDAVRLLYAGLFGTILHLLVFIGLTIGLIATNRVDVHGRFLFWILGGYWISLLNLVWLARRWVVAAALTAKAQN